MKELILTFLLVVLFSCDRNNPNQLEPALGALESDEFLEHLTILSDDILLGRDTGSPGYDSASLYLEKQIRALGLLPGGTDSSYRQPVEFSISSLGSNSVSLSLDGQALTVGKDFVLTPLNSLLGDNQRSTEKLDFEAPVVFAGFGIHAPELAYSDFDSIDVAGKAVLIIRDAPSSFGMVEKAIVTNSESTESTLRERGAVAVLRVFPESYNQVRSWETIANRAARSRMQSLKKSGDQPEIPQVVLHDSVMKSLFGKMGRNYSEVINQLSNGQPVVFDTPFKMKLKASFEHKLLSSYNLAGVIKGKHSILKDQFLVITAHLDHIGTGPAIDGDSVYNGTLDNASGATALLMLAKAFKELPPPNRSIMFLWVTAEEKGLLGSDYFVKFPTIPANQLKANLNIDGIIGMIAESTDVIAYGYEHSNLSESVNFATNQLEMSISKDPLPEQNIFVRSDQYSFVKQGYPALYVVSGRKAANELVNAMELFNSWLRNRYHQPSDDLEQPMDLEGIEKELKINFLTAYHIANHLDSIYWNKHSYLYKKFVLQDPTKRF